MGNTLPNPLTIEEFEKLDLPDDCELHNGEPVQLPPPTLLHRRLQHRLLDVLRLLFADTEVLTEFPLQIPERLELRFADVGVTARDRASGRILTGAPDLVVEVLSPSNSAASLNRYRRLCFESGASAFWLIDSDEKTVTVSLKGQKFHRTYEPGDEIPLALFGREVQIPVDDIFRNL